MNYIDSGDRQPTQAFGTWLLEILTEDVSEVRWQSGFFTGDSLGMLEPTLHRLANSNAPVKALIGANDQATRRVHVEQLVMAIRAPRDDANLGVVAFQNSYFHPKTFHIRRSDGSQAGYVGSANLTGAGLSSLHVEAGMTLDTRDGDPELLINSIAQAVDSWFSEERPGLYQVNDVDDVRKLTEQGILSEEPVVRPSSSTSTRDSRGLTRLKPLIILPRSTGGIIIEPDEATPPLATARRILLPSVPRAGFPQYLLFAPGATTPTSGELALSGSNLPAGVAGLVVRLNRDSARHFQDRSGTANISIPVATLGTFRFGLFNGRFIRPRAEFIIEMRYITNGSVLGPVAAQTSIMAYGFIPGETGHGDVRMVLPAAITRNLISHIQSVSAPLPQPDDVAYLEWPTSENGAVMRITFLDRRYQFHREASDLLSNAISKGESIGNGACWLPESIASNWHRR